ncbi:MAG: ferrous iron transport protein B [Candidatus Parvarchaeota archaeon]|nr:ferrous iron transport protein B [Candidatus Jingweiarchaeum tengchongense]MCW1298662.1 ferrous iron transport protein B [Candidatus Jingweiarchaeum tengchongense]MCW1300504.1 ferrous iron transport protein B [Candidatus Jingweiarchaeum tengchongense]MCW1304681.1 ferrous iron transport protein B [Candidatus Jingweiarchaeum tengchongense]MCW1305870.1 ferrous iron transport protein B [Candidatus Jingweiarchaeum tengchongense]
MKRIKIALVGNPNVGKSCVFNYLTGLGQIVSNWPGKTVEVATGKTRFSNYEIDVIDLPGTYAIGNASDDEIVTKEYILKEKPDVIVNIVDATLLERNLFLTLQLIELKVPIVIALNFIEESKDKGIEIDVKNLEKMLGVPIVPIDALRGYGINELIKTCIAIVNKRKKLKFIKIEYDDHIERAIKALCKFIPNKQKLMNKRAFSLRILEGDEELLKELMMLNPKNKVTIELILPELRSIHREISIQIAKERYGIASSIAKKVIKLKKPKYSKQELLDRITTEPRTGLLVMLIVMFLIFFSIFYLGSILEEMISYLLENYYSPMLTSLLNLIPSTLIKETLTFALVLGIESGLVIAIPYIFTYYLVISILEDIGYLPRMAYLMDKLMHRIGLHGKSIIPMFLGFGCNVPAILATRILPSKRERFLTSILVLLIPCSARTAIILGAVGKYLGVLYALSIYALVLILIFIVGKILAKKLPGESTGLIMEMPPYRIPLISAILKKTWIRIKDFIYIAFPLIVIGSGVLGLLKESGLIYAIIVPMRPIVSGWLMLPDVAGLGLIYGVLRKEMALEMLVVLAGGNKNLLTFMTSAQMFVFSLVSAIYVPCIATIAVLAHEFGWKKAILTSLLTIFIALIFGGIVARVIFYFNLI